MTLSLSNPNPSINIVDIIPQSDSAESGQNSEPSLAIDPLDPNNIIAGAFTPTSTAYFLSMDGGATWSDFGTLSNRDKSIAWTADGSAALTATLRTKSSISLYSATTSSGNFGSPIFTYNGFQNTHNLDQPWIRTGPSDHVYIAYNDLGVTNGETASVLVSTDNGSTFTPVTLDRIGSPPSVGQDAPSVRLAVFDGNTVHANTVYAAFTRWTSFTGTDSAGNDYFSAQVVVVRSDNGGTDGFTALGTNGSGNGVSVNASPITSVFSNSNNSDITLGQERTGGDLDIAVDPNNFQHVVVAYGSAGPIGSGVLQLVVAESTDGGASWTTKFTTDASTRSALPALAISDNGTIGLLYCNYDPSTNDLSQHLLTTTNDFAPGSVSDFTLATETNASPAIKYNPYIGDFFDLTSVGNTFEGTFCASNADNGTSALFSNVSFQRDFTGTPGTSSFTLTDKNGHAVSPSIDPFFFSFTPNADNPVVSTVSSPFTASDLGGLTGTSGPSAATGSTHLLVQAMASFCSHCGITETHTGNLADSQSQDFLAAGSQVHH